MEEGEDVSGEWQTEAEHPFQKVGGMTTSVCLTRAHCVRSCKGRFANPRKTFTGVPEVSV